MKKISFIPMLDACECFNADYQALKMCGYINTGNPVAALGTEAPAWRYMETGSKKTRYWRRRNLALAKESGLSCQEFEPRNYVNDICKINFSMPIRSGGPMRDEYLRGPRALSDEFSCLPEDNCPHHFSRWFGCFADDGHLVAYIRMGRIGNLAIYGRILGHGNYLRAGAVFFLHLDVYSFAYMQDIRFLVYGAWSSGGKGLQLWKKRCGFEPAKLEEVQ